MTKYTTGWLTMVRTRPSSVNTRMIPTERKKNSLSFQIGGTDWRLYAPFFPDPRNGFCLFDSEKFVFLRNPEDSNYTISAEFFSYDPDKTIILFGFPFYVVTII